MRVLTSDEVRQIEVEAASLTDTPWVKDSGRNRPFLLAENHQLFSQRQEQLPEISDYYERQLAHDVH
jgi:hypothetical protein